MITILSLHRRPLIFRLAIVVKELYTMREDEPSQEKEEEK